LHRITYGNSYVTFLPNLIVESVCLLSSGDGAGTGNAESTYLEKLNRVCISPEREGKKSLLTQTSNWPSQT
jgi:hypothetical protein